jgi:hypothetical protein
MAPENWSQEENIYKDFYCQKPSDIYSTAMVLWELAEGRGTLPWGSSDIMAINRFVTKEKRRPSIPHETPRDFACLIESCWKDSPLERPEAADVFSKVQVHEASTCWLSLRNII